MKTVTPVTEQKAIALLARGDKYQEVADTLKREDNIELKATGISMIARRHKDTIATLRKQMQDKVTSNSLAILDKSRQLIEKKLDRASKLELVLDELADQFANNEIDLDEYLTKVRAIPAITLTELTSVTKEAFNQSQAESGALGALPGVSPEDAKAQLATLVRAIQDGNEIELQRIVFKPHAEAI